MSKRGIAIVLLLALINYYTAARVINRWPEIAPYAGYAWGVVFILFLLQLAGPFGARTYLPKLRRKSEAAVLAINWLSFFIFGVMSLFMIYGFFIDFFNLGVMAFARDPAEFDTWALIALFVATGLTVAFGLGHVRTGPRIRRVEVPLKNLPPAFDGFTIAQVSDLHVGELIGEEYALRVVEKVNKIQSDAVALTGDIVDGLVSDLYRDVAPLTQLRAKEGVFFVPGNHEYYWDGPAWIRAFESLGIRALCNTHTLIRRGDEAIVMAGVTDYSAGRMVRGHDSDPHKAAASAPSGLVKILLAHQPANFREAVKAGFDLQLSGHTHGGQYFPFTLFIRFFQTYYKGLSRAGQMWVYVNTGTGYWGPPLRTHPPEITQIILRSAKDS